MPLCPNAAPTRGRYAGYCDDHRHDRRSATERMMEAPSSPLRERLVSAPRLTGLSGQELEVLRQASEGLSSRATGHVMHVAQETVKSHRKKVIAKLGARNMANAITLGFRKGILT